MAFRRSRRFLVVLGVGILYVILSLSGVLRPVENAFRTLLMPAARTFSSSLGWIGDRLSRPSDAALLRDRVSELESRVTRVSLDAARLRELEEENAALKKLSGFLEKAPYDHVSARVISRSTDVRIATVLIDRGARDGVEIGMAVIAEDGVFIGKVISLQENVATVMLVTDQRSRVAASIAGTSRLIGLVKGEGNGVAALTLVPQGTKLERDGIIVTAGTEEKVPPHLPIGLVKDVRATETDPYLIAVMDPLIDPSRIRLVAILRPSALRPTNGL